MKQTRQDFFTANGEGIKIMTFTEFARHILRMECGESLELYAVVNRQTKGRDENYLYESDYLDVLPEQEPELPPKDDAFYDKVFTCGQSELSRRELESLPEPFDTYHVTDEEMEQIVYETEMETRDRLRLGKRKPIDFDNDRHSEIWWEEMEKAVVRHGVPYYEAE